MDKYTRKILLSKIQEPEIKLRDYDHSSKVAWDALVRSIRIFGGVLTPILVRKMPNNTYQIIDGIFRFRACKELGFKKIRCLVRTNLTDNELIHAQLGAHMFQLPLANPHLKEALSMTQPAFETIESVLANVDRKD